MQHQCNTHADIIATFNKVQMSLVKRDRSEYDEKLDNLLDFTFQIHAEAVDASDIKTICAESYIYYNSLNIFIGGQGYGKTYSILREIIKISHFSSETHLLIFVQKKASDPTFDSMKHLLTIPFMVISYDEVEDTLRQISDYKCLYDRIKRDSLMDKVDESQIAEIFGALLINDFDRKWLHTCIVLDDATNQPLIRNEKSYLSSQLAILRDLKFTVFLSAQFSKGLTTTLKSNCTTTIITRGFSKQQLRYIAHQLALTIEFDALYSNYVTLKQHDKLIVNSRTDEVIIG